MSTSFFKDNEIDTFMESLFKDLYPECSKSEVVEWLQRTPSSTTLRVALHKTSREDFISKLEEIVEQKPRPADFQIVAHPALEDAVVVFKTNQDVVNPDNLDQVVVVGSMCGASVLRGADVYAPGVLAMPANLQKGDQVSIYADPSSKVLKGTKSETCLKDQSFLENKIFIGNGTSNISRDDLFKMADISIEKQNDESSSPVRKSGVAINLTQCASNCPRLSDQDCAIIKQFYLMQNLPSLLCGHVLDPNPGDKILDMCAAPGGKTSHLAEIVKRKTSRTAKETHQPKLIACDKSQNKIDQIYQNCDRLGLSDLVDAFVQDGTKIVFDQKFGENSFDKILLDAPCSALGQRPQFCQSMKLKELKSFPNLQKKLFSTAVKLLKSPGGTLVYSTCTFTLDENEGLVAWALEKFPNLILVQAAPIIGQPGVQVPGLSEDQASLVQRFGHPKSADPLADSIGFFVAKFVSN